MKLVRHQFETIGSTSRWLKDEIAADRVTRATSARARTQTAAVGRLGRAWSSPPGGLWLSVALPIDPAQSHEILRGLSIRVGLRVLKAIESTVALPPAAALGLKWPNDVLARRHADDEWRKLAGVLIEQTIRARKTWLIIGIGLNAINLAESLPETIRHTTTSLQDLGAASIALDQLETAIASAVIGAVTDDRFDALCLAAATRRLVNLFRPLDLEIPGGQTLSGNLVGLSPITGSALIRTAETTLEAPAGSIIASV